MIKYYLPRLTLCFWASPNHTLEQMLATSGSSWKGRAVLNALTPGFPTEKPSEQPSRPIPTDVPVSEPMDVPVPEPHDVPVPDPGTNPSPAKPQAARKDRKPRSVP